MFVKDFQWAKEILCESIQYSIIMAKLLGQLSLHSTIIFPVYEKKKKKVWK